MLSPQLLSNADKQTKCHPQRITRAVAGSSAADKAALKEGMSYVITVEPAAADLDTTTGVYWSLDEAAASTSPMWLSSWGPLPITPDSDCTLSLLRIGSADVTVQVMGLTPDSTTALPEA